MNIRSISKPIIVAIATGTLAFGIGGYVWREECRAKVLEVYIFNMKSGRSIFIRTPEDRRILIDGGANADIIRRLTEIIPFYSRRIDSIIATNTDGKNITGLIEVLERYDVDRVYIPKVTLQSLDLASSTDHIYESLIKLVDSKRIHMEEVGAGRAISFDHRVTADILFPVVNDKAATLNRGFIYSKASSPEILMAINFGSTSVVLLGGASVKVQKYIASSTTFSWRGATRAGRVLIMSHSALPANVSAKLIDRLDPEYVVYSRTVGTSLGATKASANGAVKKVVPDPLVDISIKNKINLRQVDVVHIISDGESISFLK